MLYFGFGHRSFLRFLSESVSGLKCLALCSCLAEMHSQDVAARILAALWKTSGYPEEFEPSFSQFKSLVSACSGAVTKSPFPELAGHMFGPYRDFIRGYNRDCSEPEDTTRTLLALFEVSTGVRDRITVLGGAECGFIAALSHWLIDLETYVEDNRGTCLFASSTIKSTNLRTVKVFV